MPLAEPLLADMKREQLSDRFEISTLQHLRGFKEAFSLLLPTRPVEGDDPVVVVQTVMEAIRLSTEIEVREGALLGFPLPKHKLIGFENRKKPK